MTEEEEREIKLKFFKKLRAKEITTMEFTTLNKQFQSIVASKGLEYEDLNTLANIIVQIKLRPSMMSSLIKCLIPRYRVDKETFKLITNWLLSSINKLSMTVSCITIQWIIGLWEHQLIDEKTINIYYHVFFFIMLKREYLERYIARLIYILAKPEDVTRRDVSRLLTASKKYSRPQKHIIALLSLFKSYKPELVPEKILCVNIESVWKPIPKVLQLMLQDAKVRLEVQRKQNLDLQYFNWNTIEMKKKKSSTLPLLPQVGYIQIGSTIFKEKYTHLIFDISSIEDLGKLQLNVELPCNAISLLVNTAGFHLLTFADSNYQSRFSHNLYNTLLRAFFLEHEVFPEEEINKLLDVTVEFLRYIQQGVPVVNRFLYEYLTYNTGEYQSKILALLQWMTSVSVNDLQEKVLVHVQNMFYESSLNAKCKIIATLRMLITNLFISQGFDECSQKMSGPFFGQGPVDNLEDVVSTVTKVSEDLIVSGLNIHSYDIVFLSEALFFYEAISMLESQSNILTFTIAPPAVIYGSFVTSSCTIISRTCKLLLRYRDMSLKLKNSKAYNLFKKSAPILSIYAQDLVTALLEDEPFTKRHIGHFLKSIPDIVLEDLTVCPIDCLLNVREHYAFLPYLCALRKSGLSIKTKEDALLTSMYYYPDVNDFLSFYIQEEK